MAQDDWNEIKSRVEGLGLKLKMHVKQETGHLDDREPEPDSGSHGDADSHGKTRADIEELGEKLQEAFAGFSKASKDPAVRADVKEIGAMLKDTMIETISNVSSDVGDRVKKSGDSDQSPPPPPDPPSQHP
jgi:hypothetical protein